MPIRFACNECGQKLSAKSRQVGHVAKCPKCKHDVTVPEASTRTSSGGPPPEAGTPAEGEETGNVYSQFAVYDDDEWIYEEETEQSGTPSAAVNIDRVSIPRSILYAQGVLLAVVATISFVFGVLTGGSRSSPESAQHLAQPCTVTGHVRYVTLGGNEIPDEGSVVIVLPQDQRPSSGQRVPIEGLRPSDPLPQENHSALRTIRMLGGAYTRTDANGNYDLRLPAAGQYYVLVLSRNRYRNANEEPTHSHLAQIGGYFLPATDLLGDHCYQWVLVAVRADQSLGDVVF